MTHAGSDVNTVTNKHKCDTRAPDMGAKNKKTNFHRECFTRGLPRFGTKSKREEDQLSKIAQHFCGDTLAHFGSDLQTESWMDFLI